MSGHLLQHRVSVLSKPGGRERNEDACGYWTRPESCCYVLADGAGGHGGGDVASRLAVQTVLEQFSIRPEASPQRVLELLAMANDALLLRQIGEPELSDMRSTIVLLTIDPARRSAAWGHVGDSRLYCLHRGMLVCRTKDHSLVQGMLDAGVASGAAGVPGRNVLTASLGAVDTFSPTVSEGAFEYDDAHAFLLCSDGFWDFLDDALIESSLHVAESPENWLQQMEKSLVGRIGHGSDNYSAIAVWCGDPDPATRIIAAPANSTLP